MSTSLECDEGTFGTNCSGVCCYCRQGQCDKYTGICASGCEPRYH